MKQPSRKLIRVLTSLLSVLAGGSLLQSTCDTNTDPGLGGGPIDPDVFQNAVDNFDAYLRG
jgi:hypothetical protein